MGPSVSNHALEPTAASAFRLPEVTPSRFEIWKSSC